MKRIALSAAVLALVYVLVPAGLVRAETSTVTFAPPYVGSFRRLDGAAFAEQTHAARQAREARGKPPAPSPVTGTRETLVILFNFAADPAQSPSPAEMRATVFGAARPSVATFYEESSFGRTTIVGRVDPVLGDVTNWLTINANTNVCDYPLWGKKARTSAGRAGWKVDAYDHVIHFFPSTESCSFNGVGMLNSPYSWINGLNDVRVIAHELGHNLGMRHADAYRCTDPSGERVSAGGSCVSLDGGDPMDVMGTQLRHPSAYHKAQMGWIDPQNTLTITESGTYSVAPIEIATSNVQSLRIERAPGEYVYIDHRSTFGYDDYGPTHWAVNGAAIRVGGPSEQGGPPALIDTVPATLTNVDATLFAGRGFFDPVGGIHVRTVEVSPDALVVRVTLGYTDAAPTADAGSGHAFPRFLAHTHTGASTADLDADLSSYTWVFQSCPSACPSMTGASGVVEGSSDDVPGPTYTANAPGIYRLTLTVRDGAGRVASSTVEETAI